MDVPDLALCDTRTPLPFWVRVDTFGQAAIGKGSKVGQDVLLQWTDSSPIPWVSAVGLGTAAASSDIVKQFETKHPYPNKMVLTKTIYIENALSLFLTFDPRCQTERNYDKFILTVPGSNFKKIYDGTNFPKSTLKVPGNTVVLSITSDGSQTYWGVAVSISGTVSGHGTRFEGLEVNRGHKPESYCWPPNEVEDKDDPKFNDYGVCYRKIPDSYIWVPNHVEKWPQNVPSLVCNKGSSMDGFHEACISGVCREFGINVLRCAGCNDDRDCSKRTYVGKDCLPGTRVVGWKDNKWR